MSYTFPRYRPRIYYIVDFEDWNEIFMDLADELGGHLNEHNFVNGAFTSRTTSLADDVAFRVFGGTSGYYTDDAESHTDTVGASTRQLYMDGQWLSLETAEVTASPGGLLWCNASVQAANVGGTSSGAFFAIRVDNTVIIETLTGSAEYEQDRNTAVYGGVGGDSSPSVFCGHTGVVLDALVPVEPGEHTVEIVAMRYPNFPSAPLNDLYYVKSAELVVIEMAR